MLFEKFCFGIIDAWCQQPDCLKVKLVNLVISNACITYNHRRHTINSIVDYRNLGTIARENNGITALCDDIHNDFDLNSACDMLPLDYMPSVFSFVEE